MTRQPIGERIGQPAPRISDAALNCLQAYDWPGNVRELENLLTQAAVHARSGLITPDLLAFAAVSPGPGRVPQGSGEGGGATADLVLPTLDAVEAEHIQRVLDHVQGHKGRTCEILGISRPALDRKILQYGLRVPAR